MSTLSETLIDQEQSFLRVALDRFRQARHLQVHACRSQSVLQEVGDVIGALGSHDDAEVTEDGASPLWGRPIGRHAILLLQLPISRRHTP